MDFKFPGHKPCGQTTPHEEHQWTYLHADDTRLCAGVRECFHVIHHARTDEERAAVTKQLRYSRRIGDMQAVPRLLLQLQPCPHDQEQEK